MNMLSLEMLTEAADLVETRDKQKRLMGSPSPSSDIVKMTNHKGDEDRPNSVTNGKGGDVSHESQGSDRQPRTLQNGQSHNFPRSEHSKIVKNLNGHGTKDEVTKESEEDSEKYNVRTSSGSAEFIAAQQQNLYQYRLAERTNGLPHRQLNIKQQADDKAPTALTPKRHQHSERRSTSPTADTGGDNQHSTKPMVLLQHPSAATLSSVGATHPVPGANPALQTATMHHPFLYPMMYPAAASLDGLGLVNRGPGNAPKDGEGHVTSPNGSPNAPMSAVSAPMHLPAGLMYPFANQALMMGGRGAGGLADISPFLLAQSPAAYAGAAGVAPNLAVIDQYKRLFEGIPQVPAYSLQPHHLTDQYIKSLMAQGAEGSKEALTLSAIGARLPPGIPLTSLQGQPGASDLWLRYPEHLNAAAVGVIRPHDGISPRSGSPYTNKRRSESPGMPNGVKASTSGYPYGARSQPLNSLNGSRIQSRSPAAFSHGQRSRSPQSESRKPEVDRANYRTHSRDLDRDGKPVARDVGISRELASTSASSSHSRTNADQHPFSLTDEIGRKIGMPQFYPHLAHGYPGLPGHLPGHERSPSPQSRASDEMRAYRRASRERSPGGDQLPSKRRSLDNQYLARQSPTPNDRHNSRPSSPATNGQIPTTRHQLPLVNGSLEAAAAAEFAKANQHLLLPMAAGGSPNATVFGEAREQRNGSPATNPYLAGGVSPYLGPHLVSGLAGPTGTPLFLPHYAQALAASAKGSDLTAASFASLYKTAENGVEYPRIPLPFNMAATLQLLPQQQQQQLLATAGRPSVLTPEYAAALKSREYMLAKEAGKARENAQPGLSQEYAAAQKAHEYFTSLTGAKETEKASPVNGREKHSGLPQGLHPSLLGHQPAPALSPSNPGVKSKHSSSPMPYMNVKSAPHNVRMPDSHSPTSNVNLNNSVISMTDGRRYLSPQSVVINDRQGRENSPKPPTKHYRPQPMLDLAERRNRKLKRKIEDEIAVGEEASNFLQGKQHLQTRPEQREKLQGKDLKKDPKRRKQIIAEGDPDIEEHFRRSLGKDYKVPETQNKVSITGSVDDHFKKALGGEVWNKLQTTASVHVKNESRDVAAHTTHVLPSYSVAVAGVAQSGRGHSSYQDTKEPLSRIYESSYLPRDRYHIQNVSGPGNHTRRPTKSPPDGRTGPTTGSTVLYPPQPIVPARQRVKAKGVVIPEAPTVSDLTNRSARPSSLGSKGSSRTISGSSAESLPTAHAKRSPSPLPPAASLPEVTRGVTMPITMTSTIPYQYGPPHPSTAANTTASVVTNSSSPNHGVKSSNGSWPVQRASPPSAPSATAEEMPGSRFPTSESAVPDHSERQSPGGGKSST